MTKSGDDRHPNRCQTGDDKNGRRCRTSYRTEITGLPRVARPSNLDALRLGCCVLEMKDLGENVFYGG